MVLYENLCALPSDDVWLRLWPTVLSPTSLSSLKHPTCPSLRNATTAPRSQAANIYNSALITSLLYYNILSYI